MSVTPTTPEAEICMRWFEANLAGDVDTIVGLFADDIEFILPGTEVVPWAGTWRGLPEIDRLFGIIGQTLDIRSLEPTHLVASGENVVLIGNEHSVIKATGTDLHQRFAWLFTVRGGKIARWEGFEDTEGIVFGCTGA